MQGKPATVRRLTKKAIALNGDTQTGSAAMNAKEVLATLKQLGKAQTAAIYQRHGSGKNVFGVLSSEIAKLQKKIKVDHPLAMELWRSGNAEARILALQIADPEQLTRADADRLVQEGPARFVGSYLAGLLSRSPLADEMMRAWMKSKRGSPARDGVRDFQRPLACGSRGRQRRRHQKSARDYRAGDPPLSQLGAAGDEWRVDLDRHLQAGIAQAGDRGGQAHRKDRGRPRRDELQDA